jgi:valyl-tRNA synthetase
MNNIHDWTISRQLWWGHRIPVWHCQGCKEIIIARETPRKCTRCGGANLQQDTDVLDTWFSSGLLPFTTLGWPDKTRDEEVFYPTTLLITAYEILFFWVARMIMFGCHFMKGHQQDALIKGASGWADRKDDSVPFRQVYIHALVRDAERQKMSKTKGNIIDPLEIIDRFGTDATRFTLAAMAAPGTDITFNESRTEGYRNFANKIWNAARFMFMNIHRAQEKGFWSLEHLQQIGVPNAREQAFESTNLEDQWILARFNAAASEVNASLSTELAHYRFDHAASSVYDFFWTEFCDWYIELIKPRLASDNAREVRVACTNLATVFEGALRLLHPFMPFITEELWQSLYEGRPPYKSISLAPFPSASYKKGSVPAETEMAILQDLIVSIRNLRAELKIAGNRSVDIEVFSHDPETRTLIQGNATAIRRLALVKAIAEVTQVEAFEAPTRSTARFDVRVVYQRSIDLEAERTRLQKELERWEKEIDSKERQLGNQQFLSKAPASVVEGLRKRVEELVVLRNKARSALKELG